jgi:putative methionine-R-sulfoxide reductase with GAF domain
MQATTKKLSVTFTFLFFAGLLASAYTLYQLPAQIVQMSPAIDLRVLGQLQPALIRTYVILAVTAICGLTTVAFFTTGTRNGQVKAGKQTGHLTRSEDKQEEKYEEESQESHIDQEAIEQILASEDNPDTSFTRALSLICKELEASQAAAYQVKQEDDKRWIELFASYAYHVPEGEKVSFRFGEGLTGQVAKEGKPVNINAVPEGYIKILSGLGSATPNHLIILPLREGDEIVGVVEIASFHAFNRHIEAELQQAFDKLALKLVNDDNVSLEKAKS